MARKGRARFVALTERVRQLHPHAPDPHRLVREGLVEAGGVIITNPAALVRSDAAVRIRRRSTPRGQAKLTAALAAFEICVSGRVAADIGASTGGFTLALLEAGAKRVYAVDAGHGQLLGTLRADPRVMNREGTNLADLSRRPIPEEVDVVTVDLSYLAIADAAPQLDAIDVAQGADMVALVKPMYELHLAAPPEDPESRRRAVELAVAALERHGWCLRQTVQCPVRGRRGAVEHLIHMGRRGRDIRAPKLAGPHVCDGGSG